MVKMLLLIFFTFICEFCIAQKQLDSLLNELKRHDVEDTSRLNLLTDISYKYSDIHAGKGLAMADEAIVLAQHLNNGDKLASAYRSKAANYHSESEDSLALDYYNKALRIYKQLNIKTKAAAVLQNIGLIYQKSNFYTALQYHQQALNDFEQENDAVSMANCYRSMGVDYQYLSQYPKALECLQKAFNSYEKAENKSGMAGTFGDMGIVYTYLENLPRALQYHQKSLELYELSGDKKGMADELGNLGNVYDNMDDSANALQSYHKALEISESAGFKRSIASNTCNIGIVYSYYGDYLKAFGYLSKAYSFYQKEGDKINTALTLDEIAKIYVDAPDNLLIKMGVNPKDRFPKAIQYQKHALALARETGSINSQATRWQSLSNTYEGQKDFAKSLDAYKQAVLLRDSASNTNMTREITRLEMQNEFDKKQALARADNDKKHALAIDEINKQKIIRNASIGIGALLVLSAIAGIILYKRRKDIIEKKKEAEFNTQVAYTELKALRAQMNPHFIYNSLNSINDYIDKHETELATSYTTKFAKLMRMILENSEQKAVPLADDLKALELYMQLESMRMQNKFNYEIKVDDGIDQENTLIPPLILQPFVENSIWHGISKKQGVGKIMISIHKEGNMINCIVEDNGIGMKESAATKTGKDVPSKKSFGMKITNARIDILNKTKKSNAAVIMSHLEEGTKIEIKLPEELAF